MNYQEKHRYFLLIFKKSVEPIFQQVGPISRHVVLWGNIDVKHLKWHCWHLKKCHILSLRPNIYVKLFYQATLPCFYQIGMFKNTTMDIGSPSVYYCLLKSHMAFASVEAQCHSYCGRHRVIMLFIQLQPWFLSEAQPSQIRHKGVHIFLLCTLLKTISSVISWCGNTFEIYEIWDWSRKCEFYTYAAWK